MMKKTYLYFWVIIFAITLLVFNSLFKIYPDYQAAIIGSVEKDDLHVFQIKDILFEKEAENNQYFVFYKNLDNIMCAGVFDKTRNGYRVNSLSIGVDQYELSDSNGEIVYIEANASPYEGGIFYYGKIANYAIKDIYIGTSQAIIENYGEDRLFYFVDTNDFSEILEFECIFR